MRIADELQVTCPVFYVDNVFEYWSEHRKAIRWDDLPCVVPPFPDLWLEFTGKEDEPIPPATRPAITYHCGMRIRTYDKPTKEELLVLASSGYALQSDREPRWVSMYTFYGRAVGHSRIVKSKPGALWINEDGTAIVFQARMDYPGQEAGIKPALLAISFMHCKNVRRVENTPPFQRARIRRGEQPLLKFYTLEIDPMKEVLRREGRIEEVGLKRALHICRGHFATYEGKGLFGKYPGTFWRPAHVRGTAEAGAVVKDYSVKAPLTGAGGGR